jgi:uncharacterized heparinase superfamily protein
MAELTLKERLRKAALTVDEPGKRSTLVSALAGPLKRWAMPATPVDHLLIVPQDLRTADPSFWHEMEYGQFGLAGSIAVLRGRSPFEIEAPSPAWARELHSFGWLRHLDAAGSDEARDTGRKLALEWVLRYSRDRGLPAEPAVAARRLISWLSHANLLLEDVDKEPYGAITASLGAQLSHLSGCWREAPSGYPRLLALTALAFAALSLAGHERQIKDIEANLVSEIAWQILDDGGHVSRHPGLLVELLLDLLPLSQCFTARGRALPKQLGEALEHMLPMLRYMRLGDGMVARFNGVGCAPAAGLATVLAYEDGSLPPLAEARASGYARLERGASIVVADVGRPPPLAQSACTQAGCLSFEMSVGTQLLFVNGGAPDPSHGDWLPVARATASHNTLTLAEKSSSRLIAHRKLEALMGAPPLRYPDRVDWRCEEADGGKVLEASHDGYHRRYDLVHYRHLHLSADGLRFEGCDRLDGQGNKVRLRADMPFAIHFHLLPSASCALGRGVNEAIVTLADGQHWRFTAQGAVLSLEESAYFAESAGPRPAQQIVLRGATAGETEVNWVAAYMAEDDPAREETE